MNPGHLKYAFDVLLKQEFSVSFVLGLRLYIFKVGKSQILITSRFFVHFKYTVAATILGPADWFVRNVRVGECFASIPTLKQ